MMLPDLPADAGDAHRFCTFIHALAIGDPMLQITPPATDWRGLVETSVVGLCGLNRSIRVLVAGKAEDW
jgi:hypothetical protein